MSNTDPTSATADVPSSKKKDERKLIKTRYPGVYKRVNGAGAITGYVAVYTAGGKQRKKVCKTLDEARRYKRTYETDDDRGEFVEDSKLLFVEYLTTWVEEYQGNGKRGFREGTRSEYRRIINTYAVEFFSPKLRLTEVTPKLLGAYLRFLKSKGLSDSSMKNGLNPVRAALGTAHADGEIKINPAMRLRIPKQDVIEEDEDEIVKALSREQLTMLLSMIPKRHAMMFRLIASTGLRVSEAVGLQLKHLQLDGSDPHVKIRRAISKGRVEPPKTKYGRRDVPLSPSIVRELRAHVATLKDQGPDASVFVSQRGTPVDPNSIRPTLRPIMEEIGAAGLAFHALRHTFASLQLASGANILQLSRALGHHSAAFTLSTYAHLLPGDQIAALDLEDVLVRGNAGGNVLHGSQTHDAPAESLLRAA